MYMVRRTGFYFSNIFLLFSPSCCFRISKRITIPAVCVAVCCGFCRLNTKTAKLNQIIRVRYMYVLFFAQPCTVYGSSLTALRMEQLCLKSAYTVDSCEWNIYILLSKYLMYD